MAEFMEVLLFLSLFVHPSSDPHTLQSRYTAHTPGINFPEFTAVSLVDGEQCVFYNSSFEKVIPKTEWIQRVEADEPDSCERQTQSVQDQQENFQVIVKPEVEYRALKLRAWEEEPITLQSKTDVYGKAEKIHVLDEDHDLQHHKNDAVEAPIHTSDPHSLQYLYTALTPGIQFPEFTAVGLVDGEQIVYYNSGIMKMIPKTQWIKKFSADDPDYWEKDTEDKRNDDYTLRVNMERVKKSFNQTQGNHTLQRMYGCELYNNGTTRGYDQYGYDGEDFISLNLKTGTWTADKPQAEIFLKQWDPTGQKAKYWRGYMETECINRLKKFVLLSATLKRKDRPAVSLFQKHSCSPEVVCHATGFFPKALNITWRKDGEDVHEDVELRETLPNQDGTFQKRSILKVPAEELQKHTYTCVIQHSSLEKELVLEVPKCGALIAQVVIAVPLLALVAVVGFLFWKKMNSDCKPVPKTLEREENEDNEYEL